MIIIKKQKLHYLLLILFLFITTNSFSEQPTIQSLIKKRETFYTTFLEEKKASALKVNKIWKQKYSKMIINRPHWEIQIRKMSPQGRRPDCVPTCIAMICEYYNVKHDPPWKIGRRIRSRGFGKLSGTSIQNTIKELKQSGLKVAAYSGNLKDIKQKIETGVPVLIFQEYSKEMPLLHARIVIGYNNLKNELTIIDPNFGNSKTQMKYDVFLSLWDGTSNCTILAFK